MCHKTASLVANALESSGIATVVVGTMHKPLADAPRSLITRYPNAPMGPPGDLDTHYAVAGRAIRLLSETSHVMENYEPSRAAS